MTRLLIVDDEPAICASLSFALEDDFDVFTAKDEQTALAVLEQEEIDCVLLDLNLGSTSGLELLPKLKKLRPDLTVIMMTAFGTIESSVAAMKAGAYHYLTKPLHLDEVKLLINKALEFQKLHKRVKVLSAAVKQQQSYAGMIGKSQQMQRIYQLIEKVKDIPSNILITGESGTGKELVARAIHYQGVRSQAAFSVINCAAIPETLLESELFGYAKGAFTGAVQQKTGLFERSHGGTVFLDEIGEMPLALQAKLLRVIQERTVTPLGSYSTKEIDIRLIAATNRNLEEEVAKGTFREDLYYRLNVIPIRTPALRERPEDVPLLVDYFLDLYAANMGREKKECSPDVKKKLFAYSFPGNVRELANIIEYAIALSAGEILTMEDLPASLVSQPTGKRLFPKSQEGVFVPANATLEEAERLVILHTLEKNGGHRKKTADQLGISERGLRQKLKQYLES
ncbi:sigma-54-dependent Fis family transcriptional regulator [Brevibacillus borstelensis]|uniref:sigma-54-dependent transcriptional regulator n=2 Tax=Brevibacillus TaxID=55080 RepID=UPI000F07C3C1|nr:sigma-54 dependent transcriptional regulator [Brevibacillus borstelensis]MCM3470918.1 sigma-54 dependent transcriptional regulator [Brevibacillus borstelensis]MED1881272.1 sigma-54 dependent transcriptional regulator [Brevibacillus borstelensis]RNB57140.1 sigma-54-dependent Fis family transcriptional regulator [Brevibacillus borstelensis]GED54040.1 acetoacetate metabolism regulatory protein AtoC [Brevibacillus borstelensis]